MAARPTSHSTTGQPPEPHGVPIAPGVRVHESVLRFSFARSSGPGGQNVNKLETKAELRVSIDDLPIPGRARGRLRTIAGDRITGAETFLDPDGRSRLRGGELALTSQEHRSQSQNKTACMDKLRELLVAAMAEPKVRRKTRPSRGSIERRLEGKRRRGDIKRTRGNEH
jgi:ribosome-associated protein